MKGESAIKRDEITVSDSGISVGGAVLIRSARNLPSERGCAVIEQTRRPVDIVLRRSRLRVYLPGRKAPAVSRRLSCDGAFCLFGDYSGIFRDEDGVAGEKNERVIERKFPLAASFCMCRSYFTALLFLPLAAAMTDGAYGTGIINNKAALTLAAAVILLPFIRTLLLAEKNACVHYVSSGGVVNIARGAVSRRILCFPEGAADASVDLEIPLPGLRGRCARVLCVSGVGMVPVPESMTSDPPESKAVMRLERHNGQTGGWGGELLTASAALLLALRFILTNWGMRYYIAAALIPMIPLLVRRSIAVSLLADRPAALLYRDELIVSGIWDGCVVRARIGRDNIARAEISQDLLQRQRGLCTLTVKAAGCMRAVACRNVDYLRARALAERLYRG